MTSNLRLGLTGHPLGHSLSPKIHAAALAACGLTGNYSLFPIHPDDKPGLADLLARVRSGEIHGLNVTIPHKQNVIPLLDGLTETAKAIGAVNTISMRSGQLIGDNTDAPGFLADLHNFLALTPTHLPGGEGQETSDSALPPGDGQETSDSPLPPGEGPGVREALILGAGGSARAVVYALLHDSWNVTLAARRLEQAEQLAQTFSHPALRTIDFFHLSSFILHPSKFILIVNTTPLGMTPNLDTTPWELPFPENAAIYDLVYNPRETRLVREARAAGLPATTGLGMLIEQAALAFEIWTGCQPPRDVLWQAVEN